MPASIEMPQSFRPHIRMWMRSIDMPETQLRMLFLWRYQALLILRAAAAAHLLPPTATSDVSPRGQHFAERAQHEPCQNST